jgi:hypothetical protein
MAFLCAKQWNVLIDCRQESKAALSNRIIKKSIKYGIG